MKKRNTIGQFIRTMPDRNCLTCGKVFYHPAKKTKYHSKECYYKMKKIRGDHVEWTDEMKEKMRVSYTGKGNPGYGKPGWSSGKKRPEITGEKHFNWKGGFTISKDGYKVIQNEGETKQKKVLEHRMVMEEYLGRKLESSEIIHHKNYNKLDNRVENLMMVTRQEHIKIHPPTWRPEESWGFN